MKTRFLFCFSLVNDCNRPQFVPPQCSLTCSMYLSVCVNFWMMHTNMVKITSLVGFLKYVLYRKSSIYRCMYTYTYQEAIQHECFFCTWCQLVQVSIQMGSSLTNKTLVSTCINKTACTTSVQCWYLKECFLPLWSLVIPFNDSLRVKTVSWNKRTGSWQLVV